MFKEFMLNTQKSHEWISMYLKKPEFKHKSLHNFHEFILCTMNLLKSFNNLWIYKLFWTFFFIQLLYCLHIMRFCFSLSSSLISCFVLFFFSFFTVLAKASRAVLNTLRLHKVMTNFPLLFLILKKKLCFQYWF